ncbi:hypothetical protein, partial [Nevskia ramosa]|uniref:hypothetical protein n=1 Tax=Nevskia ramosa TaxID=64002 RepID=UPI002358029C
PPIVESLARPALLTRSKVSKNCDSNHQQEAHRIDKKEKPDGLEFTSCIDIVGCVHYQPGKKKRFNQSIRFFWARKQPEFIPGYFQLAMKANKPQIFSQVDKVNDCAENIYCKNS